MNLQFQALSKLTTSTHLFYSVFCSMTAGVRVSEAVSAETETEEGKYIFIHVLSMKYYPPPPYA